MSAPTTELPANLTNDERIYLGGILDARAYRTISWLSERSTLLEQQALIAAIRIGMAKEFE